MAELKDNAYQIKFKLTPKKVGYKGVFVSGIVFANNQVNAVKEATERLVLSVSKEPMEIEVKLQSAVKIRNDFFFIVDQSKIQG